MRVIMGVLLLEYMGGGINLHTFLFCICQAYRFISAICYPIYRVTYHHSIGYFTHENGHIT